MLKKIIIENFKLFEGRFELDFKDGINIIVGNNEAGKSTILEAIHLATSGFYQGKPIKNNISQYLFNEQIVKKYLLEANSGNLFEQPYILIELYFDNDFPILEGDMYSKENISGRVSGVALKIAFDEKYQEEYESIIGKEQLTSMPIEYFDVEWYSFARKAITSRVMPIKSSFIDVGVSKNWNGSDVYISRIIRNILEIEEQTKITQAFRESKEFFSKNDIIKEINTKINSISKLSKKTFELDVDLSTNSTWNGSLITKLDNIPFEFIGKGEQSIVKIDLALSDLQVSKSSIILIEEPESHLSHSRLNELMSKIESTYQEKQIILTTHNSFVANKLGLDNLILLSNKKVLKFSELESKDFFKKIAGYDTLRFILSKRSILVEGDSDELIVQRAYMDNNEGKIPIEDGLEVISVGTSFLRFLEIAKYLQLNVSVIIDNDGNIESLENKFKDFINNKHPNIGIFYDSNIYEGSLKIGKEQKSYNYNTLEPLLLKENSIEIFNSIFDTNYEDDNDMKKYMKNNKTECSLKIFNSHEKIKYPDYILRGIHAK